MPTIDTSTYDVIIIGAGPAGEITDRPSGSNPPPSSHGISPLHGSDQPCSSLPESTCATSRSLASAEGHFG